MENLPHYRRRIVTRFEEGRTYYNRLPGSCEVVTLTVVKRTRCYITDEFGKRYKIGVDLTGSHELVSRSKCYISPYPYWMANQTEVLR